MPKQKGSKSGEAKPLLAKNSQHHADDDATDEESHPVGYFGAAGALAPPPSSAPPPPPQDKPSDSDNTLSSYQNNPNESTSSLLLLSASNDDSASQSQLSLSQSNKSGKSGKSSSRRKKKNDGTSSSAKTKSSNKSKSKKKKKKDDGRPQKSMCHFLFDAVRYLAILASCMMLLMQIIPMMILGDESTWLQIAVRSYLAIFCISFVLTESRIPFLQRILSPHSNWILRGFLYSFIGLIGMEQDIALKVEEAALSPRSSSASSILGPGYGTLFATLFMSITSWIMIGVGVLYTMLGLFCMQGWYGRMEKAHGEKVREWRDKKKGEENFRKDKEEYREYEKDRREGRGEWYDDLE